MPESRYQLKERVKAEGQNRWAEFKQRREELKAEPDLEMEEVYDILREEFSQAGPKNTRDTADDFLEEAEGEEGDQQDEERGGGSVAETDPIEIVRFVFDHAGQSMRSIDKSKAPCPGALEYLRAINNDKSLKADFYTRVWSKLLKKIDHDNRSRHQDDGRQTIGIIDRIQRESREVQQAG